MNAQNLFSAQILFCNPQHSTTWTGGGKLRLALPPSVAADPRLVRAVRQRIKACLREARIPFKAVKPTRSDPGAIKIQLCTAGERAEAAQTLCDGLHALIRLGLPAEDAMGYPPMESDVLQSLRGLFSAEELSLDNSGLELSLDSAEQLGRLAGQLIMKGHVPAARRLLELLTGTEQAVVCTHAWETVLPAERLHRLPDLIDRDADWAALRAIVQTCHAVARQEGLTELAEDLAPYARAMAALDNDRVIPAPAPDRHRTPCRPISSAAPGAAAAARPRPSGDPAPRRHR
jgi:hypothetical protein